MALDQFFVHIGLGFAVLVFGVALFAFGLLGGGDAKLLAAAALWIGYDSFLPYLFSAALIGAALSIVILMYRGIIPPLWMQGQPWAMRLYNKKEGIPYGIALAGGALWVFPTTSWFLAVAA